MQGKQQDQKLQLEEFDSGDIAQMARIARDQLAQQSQLIAIATSKLEETRRQVARAQHEIHRLERHQRTIRDFCKKYNINIEEE